MFSKREDENLAITFHTDIGTEVLCTGGGQGISRKTTDSIYEVSSWYQSPREPSNTTEIM